MRNPLGLSSGLFFLEVLDLVYIIVYPCAAFLPVYPKHVFLFFRSRSRLDSSGPMSRVGDVMWLEFW